jgi:iron complex outermembrane recepter protein
MRGASADDTVESAAGRPRTDALNSGFPKPSKPRFCAIICASLALLCEQPCAAQTAVIGDDERAIVVTAQRRLELAHDVPISITALSGEQLERMQATDTASLERVVPSLTMTRTSVFTQPFLRGVGKRSNLGVENGVATYVDGVYLASSISALLDLRGIERIEVLNGPQGTLFGRNATGGVIQVVTRDPSAEDSGKAELHAGSDGYIRGDLYLTGGNDSIAGNAAISLSHDSGYGTNFFTGRSDQGRVDHSFVGRSKWVWRPDMPLTLTFAADYQDLDQDWPLAPVPGYPPIGRPPVRNFHDGNHDTPNRFRFRYGGASLKAEADIGSLTFMSLSALRRMHARWSLDLDTGPQPLTFATPIAEQDQFSQEFQLQSGDASPIQWVAGLYYIHLDERYDPTISRYGGSYSAQLGGRLQQTLFSSGTTSSYAAYGQGTVPLGQATRLTLGVRYTSEDRAVEANAERLFAGPPLVRPIPGLPLLAQEPFRNSDTFSELTWRASLDRRFSDEVMGYLLASRGFQSGGWNLQTPQNPAYDPETLDDFEAGLKYADRTRRFRADANVFYYDYSDLQVSALTPIGQATTNAASAEIYGLELQVEATLARGTDITLGAQALKAHFKSFLNATCTNYDTSTAVLYAPTTCDVTGNDLPFAPEFKFNIGATQRLSLRERGSLLLSGNIAYNSGYFAESDNVVHQASFATLDASAEWQPGGRWPSVRMWASNLTNAHHYNALATVATVGILHNPAAPRRIGVSISSDF